MRYLIILLIAVGISWNGFAQNSKQHWLNNNVLWDFYYKWKAIKIEKKWMLSDNVEFKIGTQPNFMSTPIKIIKNPKSIVNIDSYNINATISYFF